jgi:hypothetical protein
MGYEIDRKELYRKVWEKPLRDLAKEFDVSDVAIGKACRRADIPRPGQGYWAKLKAGKATKVLPLPPRFPGASDVVRIGFNYYSRSATNLLEGPVPDPPVFEEELDSVQDRISKLVGNVRYRKNSQKVHPIISKLLEQDEDRRKEYERYHSDWYAPKFDSPIEKRRLRILNTIFFSCATLGCKTVMSTSKYESNYSDASIKVGDQHVGISLKKLEDRAGKHKTSKHSNNKLHLLIKASHLQKECVEWKEDEDSKIEHHLTEIVNKILLTGEIQYRDNMVWQYEWQLQRREEMLEEERQKKLEEARMAKEAREKEERERIERLLHEAQALQQATTIRDYVETIRIHSKNIPVDQKVVDDWSIWALNEADRIDPIKNLSFLHEHNR